MRKIILITMAAIFAVGVMAQQKMRVWKNNSLAYEEEVMQIDSITFYEEYEGALNGVFSVSPTKKVRFSKGNLQYQASTNTWRFAEKQWDVVGDDTYGTVYVNDVKCNNEYISNSYTGWIDLFGWGTGNNPTNTSFDNADYDTFVDWGTNIISNGGQETNKWYSLGTDEWAYLFYTRTNATSLFGCGNVNGINGLILLPDNWVKPDELNFTPSTMQGLVEDIPFYPEHNGRYYYNYNEDNFNYNIYTIEQWSLLEAAGAVFIPASAWRGGTDLYEVGTNGGTWTPSTSLCSINFALDFGFCEHDVTPQFCRERHHGRPVRLAREVK